MLNNITELLLANPWGTINFSTHNYNVVLRLNPARTYVSITNGDSTKSIYGRIRKDGMPMYKGTTPQEIKDKLSKLNNQKNLKEKVDVIPSSTCNVCGKPLTDPHSIEIGMGVECAANFIDIEGD